MIAIKRLKNILWILIVAFGALTAYLISLRVATERNAVMSVEGRIHLVRGDIRYLETEFESRANMRQLERWNAEDYRYGAPQAAQYLPDERSLASLDGVQSNGDVYVAPPVMTAMADAAAPEAVPAVARVESPAPAQIREDDTMLRVAAASSHVTATIPAVATTVAPRKASAEKVIDTVRVAAVEKRSAPNPVARKAARMALLDAQLLDDRTLRDLGARADAESRPRSH